MDLQPQEDDLMSLKIGPHKILRLFISSILVFIGVSAQGKFIVNQTIEDTENPNESIHIRSVDGKIDPQWTEFFRTYNYGLFLNFDPSDQRDLIETALSDSLKSEIKPITEPAPKRQKREDFLKWQLQSMSAQDQRELFVALLTKSRDPQLQQALFQRAKGTLRSSGSEIICDLMKSLTTFSDGHSRDLFGLGYNYNVTKSYIGLMSHEDLKRSSIYCQFDPGGPTYTLNQLMSAAEDGYRAIQKRAGKSDTIDHLAQPTSQVKKLSPSMSPRSCENNNFRDLVRESFLFLRISQQVYFGNCSTTAILSRENNGTYTLLIQKAPLEPPQKINFKNIDEAANILASLGY